MSDREDSDVDDDFSELYKEYTGPIRSNTTSVPETTKTSKRSHADSDEEQETLDPNAVPTDFTSRDAKVWEAKSKATERNWKKRKEEEMICKLCGDSSHYTQGCPSTLGASRKSQDLFERVPARDPQVKALFTDRVVKEIEKDIGCKIKIEEKFIIVSAKDGKILSKGVDAVFKIKNEGSKMVESNSSSPKGRIPVVSKAGPTDSQRSNPSPSPRHPSNYDQRLGRQDKVIKEHVREEFQKYPRGSPQARAYGNDGIHIRSTLSKSPARRPPYPGGSYDSKDNHKYGPGPMPGPGLTSQPSHQEAHSTFSLALEELELEYKRDAMDIAIIKDKAEDEENYRHRQAIEQIRGNYMKRLATMREMHAKQWEQFLQIETRKRQQQTRQQVSNVGFGGYRNDNHHDYGDAAAANPYINNMPMDSRLRYPEIENNPSLRPNNYDFQRPRHGDHGEAYNRY